MNKLGQLKQHGAISPMGGVIKDKVDTAGGYAETGPSGKSVPCAKGGDGKGAMIEGPFGGKVKA